MSLQERIERLRLKNLYAKMPKSHRIRPLKGKAFDELYESVVANLSGDYFTERNIPKCHRKTRSQIISKLQKAQLIGAGENEFWRSSWRPTKYKINE